MTSRATARAAKTRLLGILSEHSQVNGVGLSRHHGGWILKVNVRNASESALASIPAQLDGIAVIVDAVGPSPRAWIAGSSQAALRARATNPTDTPGRA